jgi:hypothetical protein
MKGWVGLIDRGLLSTVLVITRPGGNANRRPSTTVARIRRIIKVPREDYRSGLENPCPLGYGPAVRRSIGRDTEGVPMESVGC